MLLLAGCHKNLWNDINDLKSRVQALEEKCNTMNTNITALQVLINAQSSGDMISNVSEVTYGNSTIGYTITFTSGKTITLYNGKDGANGQNGANGADGYTPSIGVAQDTDGIYYWVVDGKWLTNAEGTKIPVTSGKGEKGDTGEAGQDGTDGADGKTPQLKIEDGYWYLSYDGTNWTKLGKATGENGKDGADGEKGDNGDSMFSSVTRDGDYVYFTLADCTIIKIAKGSGSSDSSHADSDIIEFKDLNAKRALLFYEPAIDTDGDGEISYREAKTAQRLILSDNNIISFTELQFFTNLTFVDILGESLFEVTLPKTGLDTIYRIGNIHGDSRIYSLAIPNTCQCIGELKAKNISFAENSQCDSIGSIECNNPTFVLPNSVKFFTGKFYNSNLTEFTYPEHFESNLSWIFYTNTSKSSYTDIITPKIIHWNVINGNSCGVTDISSTARDTKSIFCNVDTIIFGDNVKRIPNGIGAKKRWPKLVIHNNVNTIGRYAFYDTSIDTVYIGTGLRTIESKAFYGTYIGAVYCKATLPPTLEAEVFLSNHIKGYPLAELE